MKKITVEKIIKKALGATLAASIALSSAFIAMPVLDLHAAQESSVIATEGGERVDMALGLSGLRDPVKNTGSSAGSYYVPSDYIYLGDNNRGAILWRVLSASTDNLGDAGATFVMAEYLESASLAGKGYDEAYLSYFTDEEKAILLPSGSGADTSSGEYGKEWITPSASGYLFTPSASDVANYIADYSGAPALRAYTDASRATAGSWWLRSKEGEGVGYISAAGAVDSETNTGLVTNYNRLAANLDLSGVSFSTRVDGGWRLALLDADYAEESIYGFAAWITDLDGTVAEISYVNAKTQDMSDTMGEYISVIVTDEQGSVKHYEQLGEVQAGEATATQSFKYEEGVGYTMLSPQEYYDFQGSVRFDTAGVYDYNAGDRIYIFWEKAYDSREIDSDPTLAYQTTNTSRLIDVCWHEEDPSVLATCQNMMDCVKCGTAYGGYDYYDLNSHVDENGKSLIVWNQRLGQYRGEDGFFRDGWVHSGYCESCGFNLPVDENGAYSGSDPCYCEGAAVDCVTGAICDVCGGYFVNPMMHSYDENGICNRYTHFKEPELVEGKYQIKTVGNLLWYSDYTNREEFANGADMAGAVLINDIDFSVLDAEKYGDKFATSNWTPISVAGYERDVDGDGELDSKYGKYPTQYSAVFDGNGHVIKKIHCVSDKLSYVGFIGYLCGNTGDYPAVKNLGLVDCYFENTGEDQIASAAIVAYGDVNVTIEGCYVINTIVKGTNDVGGIAGVVWNGNSIKSCYAVSLTLLENNSSVKSWIAHDIINDYSPRACFAYGENAGLIGSSGMSVSKGSSAIFASSGYYLSDEGTISPDDVKKTAEHFSSGLVAYWLGTNYGQTIGEQDYPVLGGQKVYQVSLCGGEGINRYTYSNVDTVEHVWDEVHTCGEAKTCKNCGEKFGDELNHEYTAIEGNESFIWAEDGSYDSCMVQTYCAHCGAANPELMKATVNVNFNGGVRADYVASIHIGDKRYSSEVVRIPIITIDEATGINPSSEIFTGQYYCASDLVTNTKMKPGEYEAYFLLDGENVGEYARDAGVYDLHIVGRERYDYQEYTYEDFFTIEAVEVEMTVSVKDKIFDGTQDYEFELSFSNGIDYSELIGIYAEQYQLPSAEVGEYEITEIEIYFYYGDENNISIKYNKSATARILPRNYVEIVNASYELDYEYGETVPEPKASDFTVDKGSELSFVWFKDGVVLREAPQNAGEYTLRVSASATDEYIGSIIEYTVTVHPKQLDIVIDPYGECETETEDLGFDYDDDGNNDTRTWYLVEMGETVPIYVVGLPGIDEPVSIHDERFTSTGFYLYWNVYTAGMGVDDAEGDDYLALFPKVANTEGYRMTAYTHSENTFGVSSNVGFGDYSHIEIYFRVKSPLGELKPVADTVEYSGGAKIADAILTIPKWDIPTEPFEVLEYIPTFKVEYLTEISRDPDFTTIEASYYSSIEYDSNRTMIQSIPISMTDEYYVRVVASYSFYSYVYSEGSEESELRLFEAGEEILRAKINIELFDQLDEMVDEMRAVGSYTVTVRTEHIDESGNAVGEASENSATYRIKGAPRDVYLLVKETEVELDGQLPKYNEKDIVFLTGYTLAPGHTIADLTYDIQLGGYVGAFNMGVITVKDWVIVDRDGNDVSEEYVIHSKMYEWKEKYEEVYGEEYENVKGHTVVHAYSNACDPTCNIDNCTKTREVASHKGGSATCTSQAICEVCGSEYGGYDFTKHSQNETVYVRNPDDYRYHDLVTACCGVVISTEAHTITKEATCTTLAECELCGSVEGSYNATNHSSKEMYYATNTDDASKHDHIHKCCDAIESTGSHEGGSATCTSLAICNVCSLGYGELDADNHSSDKFNYTDISSSTSRHEKTHACCGAYVGVEAHFGGEATCTHRAICAGCGAEYGDIDPENHASSEFRYSAASIGNAHYIYNACCGAEVGSEEHSGGRASCTDRALCEKCNAEYGEIDPANHSGDRFTYVADPDDAAKHSVIAECCGAIAEAEDHSGGTATCTDKAICDKCGEDYGELASHTYTDSCDADCNVCDAQRLPGHVDADKDKVCDSCLEELYSGSSETESTSESESESEGTSESESETETGKADETESKTETEAGNGQKPAPQEPSDNNKNPSGGGKKGCRSSLGAGAVTVIVSVAMAAFVSTKKKKEE